ncbi:MAG: site-2 protease family protein [Clostridia bacterium]|nr:site-2 protease family protein [Clostridia bacterium]
MTVLYVILAILIFGLLILIHEGGHFLFARLFKVTVNEFSIGMGPAIFSRKSKKSGILYSLRIVPFGGYVSMAGEDEESEDENAFYKKPVWQRFVITAAGAAMNILAGVLVMTILVSTVMTLGSTEIHSFQEENLSAQSGLAVGDRVLKVENTRVHTSNELIYEISRKGYEPIDLTVVRDGKTIVLEDVTFPQVQESGTIFGQPDFYVHAEQKTFGSVLKHSVCISYSTIKMVWESLYDLLTGRYGLSAVSGPVGVTQVMTEAASQSAADFIYLAVVISMNLGVMNLLPLPALDGGRLLFLIIEGIRRKPLSRKVEGYVHFAGFVLLMILMVVIMAKDIVGLFL